MPLYLFECQNCKKEYEEILTFSESEKYLDTECKSCNERKLTRKVSKTSFTLKGGGWYKDGYSR